MTVSAVTPTTFSTTNTSLAINLSPAVAGDLLVVNLALRYPATFTAPSGWVEVGSADAGGVGELTIFTKVATGSEGSTAAFTSSVANIGAAQCRTLTGVDTATPPQMGTANSGGVPGTTANPPALTPTWGSASTTWLAYMGTAASGATTSAGPAGYSNFAFTNYSGGGASAGTGSAYKVATAASEDPGAFTSSADRWWIAATFAVKAGGGTTPPAGTVSAALAGSGSLTATTTPASMVVAALSGSGALVATAQPALAVAASLTGSGGLSGTTTPRLTRTGALTGSGALGAVIEAGDGTPTLEASLTGSGQLDAAVTPALTCTASLAGQGDLTTLTSMTVLTWTLITPVHEVDFRFSGGMDITQPYGRSVWRVDDQWYVDMSPAAEVVARADRFYGGGRIHTIGVAERDELIAAGFGEYIWPPSEGSPVFPGDATHPDFSLFPEDG